ncbi:MAG: hypothetical protein EOO71_03035 [Myxococcaceae bacterium]|nr:MAG: hypothetical protein EOO71_03035 [Myxococcaceae bacterium]
MNKIEQKVILLLALGALAGCADTPEVRDSESPGTKIEGEQPQPTGTEAILIPEAARVIEDSSNGRFLISESESSHPFFLGRAVRCDGVPAHRQGTRIICGDGTAERAPQVTYIYIPLDSTAKEQGDTDILRAPIVTLSLLKEHGSLPCEGPPGEAFQRLMKRYAGDLGTMVSQTSSKPVAVLLEYQGSRAYGAVPATALGLAQGQVNASFMDLAPVEEGGGGGVSCTCNSSGSCPKKGQWPATWCDASSCSSCTMRY